VTLFRLYEVSVNPMAGSRRYMGVVVLPNMSVADDDAVDAVVDRVSASAARNQLAAALAALPARDRDVLLLVAWGDFAYGDVASALGIPIGTVRSRLNRARRKVRAALDPITDEGIPTDGH
jgi:RNA polymerase sigma factor (sigma-70 family)